ncbi:metalloproteinase inhibitor 1-like [Ambystoma mexicanum]|uniref:metalloproteinase inhibitor 1-like n=1 Tax=Ambystoma mexicanum TaxID=8296 RepID=UPI0037E7720E
MDIRILISVMASVLFLGGYSPAEACSCFPSHPQMHFCNANAVLKIKFLTNGTQSSEEGYIIKVLEVLKGSENFKTMTFVSTMAGTSCEITINSDNFNREYIIAGYVSDGHVSLSLCSFVKLLSQMPPEQITGMQKAYAKGCGCEITPCFDVPCPSVPSQCNFDPNPFGDTGNQKQNMMCAPDAKGICSWKTISNVC